MHARISLREAVKQPSFDEKVKVFLEDAVVQDMLRRLIIDIESLKQEDVPLKALEGSHRRQKTSSIGSMADTLGQNLKEGLLVLAQGLAQGPWFSKLSYAIESILWENPEHGEEATAMLLIRCLELLAATEELPKGLAEIVEETKNVVPLNNHRLHKFIEQIQQQQNDLLDRAGLNIAIPMIDQYTMELLINDQPIHDIDHLRRTLVRICIKEKDVNKLQALHQTRICLFKFLLI